MFFSGITRQILTALDDVTQTSATVLSSAVVFTYATTAMSGFSFFMRRISSLPNCSAIGQPAAGLARITFFSGENILTVSAINLTPHIITVLCGTVFAFTDRA